MSVKSTRQIALRGLTLSESLEFAKYQQGLDLIVLRCRLRHRMMKLTAGNDQFKYCQEELAVLNKAIAKDTKKIMSGVRV